MRRQWREYWQSKANMYVASSVKPKHFSYLMFNLNLKYSPHMVLFRKSFDCQHVRFKCSVITQDCCFFGPSRVLIWKSSGTWLAKSTSWIVSGKRTRKPTISSEYTPIQHCCVLFVHLSYQLDFYAFFVDWSNLDYTQMITKYVWSVYYAPHDVYFWNTDASFKKEKKWGSCIYYYFEMELLNNCQTG